MGAFVLPNHEIPDEADLRSFIVPGVSSHFALDTGPDVVQSSKWSGQQVYSCSIPN